MGLLPNTLFCARVPTASVSRDLPSRSEMGCAWRAQSPMPGAPGLPRLQLAPCKTAGACEIEPARRLVICLCHRGPARPGRLCKDLTRRGPEGLPDQVITWQCLHANRLRLGVPRHSAHDKWGRGRIVKHIVAALNAKRPRAFLLANVKGLMAQQPHTS